MPSLGSGPRARVALEWALRVTAFALLGWYLVETLRERGKERVERAEHGALAAELQRWSTSSAPPRVAVTLDHSPEGWERDWLGALAGAGTQVGWSGPELLPTAVMLEPRADPKGGIDVSAAAPRGATVTLRDSLGELGSAPASEWGVSAVLPASSRAVDAVVGQVTAGAALEDSLPLRRLMVVGAAGWETKFVIAALEERGWDVDAHVIVSPKGDVRQGEVVGDRLDTARYSAVLAVDSTAARYGESIARFVRQGGGLVLWPEATGVRAFAGVAPAARVGDRIEDIGRVPSDSAPREVLELHPLAGLSDDAEVLERRGSGVAMAARRVGVGRVLQLGYANSWRWRMAGGEDAPELHREWLAGVVGRVAYTGRVQLLERPTTPAPLAALFDRLGMPSVEVDGSNEGRGSRNPRWMFFFIGACLIAEWASRRLRGVR